MIIFDNCERSGKSEEEMRAEECTRCKSLLHSSYRGVVVSYDDVVVGIRGVEPHLKTSVLSHEMRRTSFSNDE